MDVSYKKCESCGYFMVETPNCGYILMEGKKRPCKPGDDCTAYKNREEHPELMERQKTMMKEGWWQ